MKATVKFKRGEFEKAFMRNELTIARAATFAVKEAGLDLKKSARGSIASAGFSKKWQNALRVDAYPKRDISINAAAHVYHKISYAHVFEDGAKISGKPTLWLPMPNVPKKHAGETLTPKRFPGVLQYIKSKSGRPLLVAQIRVSKSMANRAQMGKVSMAAIKRGTIGSGVIRSVPIFFGIDTVRIRKRFDIRGATKNAAGRLGQLYYKNLKADE